MKKCVLFVIAITLLTITDNLRAQGTAFTYQGQLTSASGGVTGLYDFQFAVFDSPGGGTQIGSTIVTNAVGVTNGLFTVTLDFGANIFTGNARWLDLAAHTNQSPNAFVSMTPRQQLTATPYAVYAGSTAGINGLTIRPITGTDASDFITGSPGNAIDTGVRGAVIAGGGTTTTSLTNHISADFSSIGGGDGNTIQAGANNSFIGGGGNNVITNGSYFSVIVGGSMNSLGNSDQYSFIGGGLGNHLDSAGGVLVGGSDNNLSGGGSSFMGGGINNHIISSSESFLGGGSGNTIQQFDGDSVLVGGQQNSVGAIYSFLGGGLSNTNKGQYSVLGGGKNNNASGNGSFVGGGGFASVVGNLGNTASGEASVVSGGIRNTASGNESAVGGGSANTAQGQYSMVPGGSLNLAGGMFSFAAGNQGKATNNGAFVWADSQAVDFSSTNNDSFNVRAQGGVRFVTGGAGLTVDGVAVGGSNGGGLTNLNASQLTSGVIPQSVMPGFQSSDGFNTVGGGTGNALIAGSPNPFASTIGGGSNNVIDPSDTTAIAATIGGGSGNKLDGGQYPVDYSTIAGGDLNIITTAKNATIAGGENNNITGSSLTHSHGAASAATIGGGEGNSITAPWGTIPGGQNNLVAGNYSFAAGQQAQATNDGAFVWADSQNAPFASTNDDSFNVRAQGGVRFVTGGAGILVDGVPLPGSSSGSGIVIQQNSNGAPNVIEGSLVNSMSSGVVGAAIGGGGATNYSIQPVNQSFPNSVTGDFGTICGGVDNVAGAGAFVGGGGGVVSLSGGETLFFNPGNKATGMDSVVVGGYGNTASGQGSFVGGGGGDQLHQLPNRASGDNAVIVGGGENVSSGNSSFVGAGEFNQANGSEAVVPGGENNVAAGELSFAAGTGAKAMHQGAFVWSDTSPNAFSSTTNNEFSVRATGGVRFVTAIDGSGNPTAGVSLVAGGGSWSSLSDRNAKKNFEPVDSLAVLAQVASLPVSTWSYKSEADVRHIGPMAQDFHAAFQVGEDDRHITVVDESGVALAAIQGLNQKLNEKDAEISELKSRLDALEKIVRSQK